MVLKTPTSMVNIVGNKNECASCGTNALRKWRDREMKYAEIYKEFLEKTGIEPNKIDDYRPCKELYGVPDIPQAVVVWLKDNTRIIYISAPDNTQLGE
ncbi:MAG: hypothetical protein NC243_11305 [Lachnoclostridium sp.]|nr:hypothetical protein [Lachnoclostridium sp.]MCM1385115.1 hypothetical protein [Lachnoclostridium sp.]